MDWLGETQWLWWVGAALVLGLVEIASLDLVFTMLAAAAIAAAGAAALGVPFVGQVLVFVIVAALLLALLRPLALRKIKPAGPGERTNTAAHVGRTAIVLSDVTDTTGLVKLAGEEWSARTDSPDERHRPGERVTVERIDGAVAVVTGRAASGRPDDADPPSHPGTPGR
ncbi:NfeD family protein [Ornithinicoccus halotolerans]|uniref:NfeD family protein n=1 Tax=Ornithinicoccus halotolerans TaxID=1748220 RepID=UPI001294ECF4|nr:NfeD family protein [Ornithinicoccus halotolerans]